MKTNKITIAAGLAVTIAALLFALMKFGSTVGWLPEEQNAPKTSETEIVTETVVSEVEQQVPQKVVLRAVGDNLIHYCLYSQARSRSTNGGYDFDYAYEGIADAIKTADIAMINQETVIDTEREPSSYPLFNSPAQLGQKVVDLGFDVVTLANNHVLDQGSDGALRAIEYWKSKDVISLGAYKNPDDMNTVRVQAVNGIKFAYVNFTSYLNGNSIDPSSPLKVISLTDPNKTTEEVYETVKNQITAAKEVADVVVVAMHWRQENVTEVPQGQIDFANYLVECGADVIIGSGPHVLQPISMIDKPDGSGQALCMYSLGNFISGQDLPSNMLSAIGEITFQRDELGKVGISDVKMIPIITHYGTNYANTKLYLFEDYTPELAASHGANGLTYDYAKNFYASVLGEQYLKNYKQ